MKKRLVIFGSVSLIFIGALCLAGCGNESHSGHDHAAHAQYKCPMDCEQGKTYDEAGTCPVCKMDLKEVESE